jgi:hypothetical protein
MTKINALATFLATISLVACGDGQTTIAALDTSDPILSRLVDTVPDEVSLAQGTQIWCPSGSQQEQSNGFCVTKDFAYGPFPRAMQDLCIKYGGGDVSCTSMRWNRGFAERIRGSGRCPIGTELEAQSQTCIEGSNAFGPFSVQAFERCRQLGGGSVCETNRWHVSFLGITRKPPVQGQSPDNTRLFQYYSQQANYNRVSNAVRRFYPEHRSNGCVAFMSEALRQSGIPVPLHGYLEGDRISLVTRPFSLYLSEELGWRTIMNASDLLPGDVMFTEDAPGWPGYPAHTYMFVRWFDRAKGIGIVVDNQDFMHQRNIFGYGTFNFTPFAYALRAPQR